MKNFCILHGTATDMFVAPGHPKFIYDAPGHPKYVGDDGGEEGLEEEPAGQAGGRGLDHAKCLHLYPIVIIIFTNIIIIFIISIMTITKTAAKTITISMTIIILIHLQICLPDFGDSFVAGQACHREATDNEYDPQYRSPKDHHKIIIRSSKDHHKIIIGSSLSLPTPCDLSCHMSICNPGSTLLPLIKVHFEFNSVSASASRS